MYHWYNMAGRAVLRGGHAKKPLGLGQKGRFWGGVKKCILGIDTRKKIYYL